MRELLLCVLLGCASAQYVKTGVKGGHNQNGYYYRGGENLVKIFGNSTRNQTQYGHVIYHNTTTNSMDYEKGVCYIEVPTASLVHNVQHVPAGNGSRPELSRIRTCCKGYVRNIHNFRICDPVCTEECINALCSAPEVCTCFPDHVKNRAGICIPTCPIGCQNGQCAGGECICKDGYELDSDSKYCSPKCRENCGGAGNCTAPNVCECKQGYSATPEGSCRIDCGACTNGDCVSPTECRCRPGYEKKQNQCVPQCTRSCGPDGQCVSPDVCKYPTNSPGQQNHNQTSQPSYPYPQRQPINTNYPNYNNQGDRHNSPSGYPYPNQGNSGQNSYHGQNSYQGQNSYHGQNYPSNQNHYYNPNQPNYPDNQQNNPNIQGYNPSRPTNQDNSHSSTQNGYNSNSQVPNYPYHQENTQSTDQAGYNPNGQVSNYPYHQDNSHSTNQTGYNPNGQGSNYPYPSNQNTNYPNEPNYYPYYPSQPNNPSSGSQVSQGSQNLYPNLNQYANEGGVQSHSCSQQCINGVCVDGSRCLCNPGYVLDNTDPTGTRCNPSCPAGCPNGVCSAPNYCICNVGYYKDTSVKGRAVCAKRIRRSVDPAPLPLIFDIPDDY